MSKEIKVGQVFRVFEVIDDQYNLGLRGMFFCESNDHYLGNKFGVNIPFNAPFDNSSIHLGIDERMHAKQVGLLRITKVK